MTHPKDVAPGKAIADMTDDELKQVAEAFAAQVEATFLDDGKGRGLSDLLRELVRRLP